MIFFNNLKFAKVVQMPDLIKNRNNWNCEESGICTELLQFAELFEINAENVDQLK